MMQKMITPAIIGFSNENTITTDTYDTNIFGESVKLNVKKTTENSYEYVYEDPNGKLSIKIEYYTDEDGNVSFNYNQIRVFNDFDMGEGIKVDYYAITSGTGIRLNEDSGNWDGTTDSYILFGETAATNTLGHALLSPINAIFHSDDRISGYVTYKAVANGLIQISIEDYQKYKSLIGVDNIGEIINSLSSQITEMGPMYQTVYYDRQTNTFGTDFDMQRSKEGLLKMIEDNEIYKDWNLAEILADDSLYPEVTPPDQTE